MLEKNLLFKAVLFSAGVHALDLLSTAYALGAGAREANAYMTNPFTGAIIWSAAFKLKLFAVLFVGTSGLLTEKLLRDSRIAAAIPIYDGCTLLLTAVAHNFVLGSFLRNLF